jgi:hypothetical protein
MLEKPNEFNKILEEVINELNIKENQLAKL